MIQVAGRWTRHDYWSFERPVGIAQADLARAIIAELHNVVIALLVPALTALGCHRATPFRPCARMANLKASFLRRRFGLGLRQGIVSAIQTPALGSHGIAPGIVGARFTSRLFLFHIVSLFGRSTALRGNRPARPNPRGSRACSRCLSETIHSERRDSLITTCECLLRCGGGSRPGFHSTVSANVAEDRHPITRRRCAI